MASPALTWRQTVSERPAIEPCPWCGVRLDRHDELAFEGGQTCSAWRVACRCGARGPWSRTARTADAVDGWNAVAAKVARVGDLELIARDLRRTAWKRLSTGSGEWGFFRDGGAFAPLQDDGTGLPILTDEARAVLARSKQS